MLREEWVRKVKQYRQAVDAYCDSLERTTSPGDLGHQWQQIEESREEAELARLALLQQPQKRSLSSVKAWAHNEVSGPVTEELVLGDVGQLGG
jgi:hypothetical protein